MYMTKRLTKRGFGKMLAAAAVVVTVPMHCAAAWAQDSAPDNAPHSAPAPTLSITLAPGAPDARGMVPYVDVTIVAEAMHEAVDEPMLRLPVVSNTVVTSAGVLENLTLSDANGPIAAETMDFDADSSNRFRFWKAPRAVDGTVTVRYRVPIDADAPPLGLPQYEMRTEEGTFSAAGIAFLLLPEDETRRIVHVSWDFSAYGADGVGASSFGVGDVTSSGPIPARQASSAYYMGGRPGIYRAPGGGFFGAWQGETPFAMDGVMEWAAGLQRFYGQFFGYSAENFGVFGRTNRINPGSGIGLTDSFAFTFNMTSVADDLRGLLAHEMLHTWVGSLDDSMDEAGGLDRAWFGEGLAVYYQRLLPWRAGLMTDAEFLADLNSTAARYYTDIMIHVPNADIPEGFWRDTRIRVLPYDRGSLYFASVDAAIRAKTGGARSLDDIVRTMLNARRAGENMDEAMWRRLLRAELGDEGIAGFEAMLRGDTVEVPSDAFGPRFRRTTATLRRYDLGFDMASLRTRPRAVQGLIPGSNAERAGLRNGDILLNSFPQDALQGDQQAYVTVRVRRGEQELEFRYQPRGEEVPAYQWELVPSAR